MKNGNNTFVKIILGDETAAAPTGAVNTFIASTSGINVIGPVQITNLNPALSGSEPLAYLITYKIGD